MNNNYPNPEYTEKEIDEHQSHAQDTRNRIIKLSYRLYVAENSNSNIKNLNGIQKAIDKEMHYLLLLFKLNIMPQEFQKIYFNNLGHDIVQYVADKEYKKGA